MINIRGEGWKEVKTVAVSAIETQRWGWREPTVSLQRTSYRAGLWDAASFAISNGRKGAGAGLEKAKRVVCVSDGAPWIWLIVAMCYTPRCVEILDWWHAVQKLWELAFTLWGQDNRPESDVGHTTEVAVVGGPGAADIARTSAAVPAWRGPTRQSAAGDRLFVPSPLADVLCGISASWVPDRERQCRIGLQSGRARTAETGRHALESSWRTSDAGLTECVPKRPVAGGVAFSRPLPISPKIPGCTRMNTAT